MVTLARRLLTGAALTALVLGTSATSALAHTGRPQSHPVPKFSFGISPSDAAAVWLTEVLSGDHASYVTATGAPDYQATADGVLALDAAGLGHDHVLRMASWLQSNAVSYVGANPGVRPGAAAWLMLVAEAEHLDPHNFDGHGLDLAGSVRAEEDADGRFTDSTTAADDSSPATQALVLMALSNTGVAADSPDQTAVDWLTSQQCADGSFPAATVTTGGTCTGDIDATAYAIQGLIEVNGATAQAVQWLDAQQNADGSFGAPDTDTVLSTALAAQALLDAGDEPTTALHWLARHQLGCANDNSGAIAGDIETFNARTAIVGTATAAQALALAPLATISGDDVASRTPGIECVYAAGGGGGEPSGGGRHRHPKRVPETITEPEPVVPTLPNTGPTKLPLASTSGICADLIFVGVLLCIAGRRRRTS